ncbi:YqjK-like family protein [Halomonas dongshanensis]|uniref:YqjK-like family protein n=1 Tax=Halomonas dongshanensis TaxID=2890835 RepID=A0ABT2ECV1_9GAMM|nr:YqjK-like family protein [Halomonas dongshanensis]MCS2608945.1 YqjK-like family protein [Halomonas dongshanensis]
MTHANHHAAPTNASPAPLSRADRKRALLATLEQQRVDLLVESDRFLEAAAPFDARWQRFKIPLAVASGALAWRLFRRPGGIAKASQRALAGYMLFRKLKTLNKLTR